MCKEEVDSSSHGLDYKLVSVITDYISVKTGITITEYPFGDDL